MDEISRLWATFQTGYRISVATSLGRAHRQLTARGSWAASARARREGHGTHRRRRLPTVRHPRTAPQRPARRAGRDAVRLVGRALGGVSAVQASGAGLTAPQTLVASDISDTGVTVTIPSSGTLLPAGTVLLTPRAPGIEAPANTVALGIAPTLVIKQPRLKAKLDNGAATVTVGCSPPGCPPDPGCPTNRGNLADRAAGEPVALIVGDRIVAGTAQTAAASSLHFQLSRSPPEPICCGCASTAKTASRSTSPTRSPSTRPDPGADMSADTAQMTTDGWEALNNDYLSAGWNGSVRGLATRTRPRPAGGNRSAGPHRRYRRHWRCSATRSDCPGSSG